MQFSPFSRPLIFHRSKYPPQHTVLKHSVYVPPLMSETKLHTHRDIDICTEITLTDKGKRNIHLDLYFRNVCSYSYKHAESTRRMRHLPQS
jgi:hypothetical protein